MVTLEDISALDASSLVSSRYEHPSLILTSNLGFAHWGDVFGDQVAASPMIDRIVHHTEVITLRLQLPAQEPPDRIAALVKTGKHGRIIPSAWLSFHHTIRLNFDQH